MGALYQIEFPNGKSYIGITKLTAERRLAVHSYRRNVAGYAICSALRKYGRDGARVRTLVVANDWAYLCELERRAIVIYGAKAPNGYNMTDGGESPVGLCPESLAKIGAAAKGNTYNLGKKRSAESRARMSASQLGNTRNRGRKHRPEVVEAIRLRATGKTASQETRAKMSASQIGKGKGASSGYVGVNFHKSSKLWRAHITINHKMISLGYSPTLEGAIAKRAAGETRLLADRGADGR